MSKDSIARILATAFAASCCLTLAACDDGDAPDSVGEAADNAADAIDNASDAVEDAVDDATDG